MAYTIAVYEGGLAYGGAEEGGWWFWAGEYVPGTTRHCDTEERAWDIVREMVARYPAGSDRTNVRPQETDYSVEMFEDRYIAPQYFPDARPHYE